MWTDRGLEREPEVQIRADVLHDIAEHMKLTLRENTTFHIAFDQLDSKEKEKINECMVNLLHYMNSDIEQDVRHSFLAMGTVLKKIGARGSPLGSPLQQEEDEEEEEGKEESEESKRHRYLQSGMEECSDPEVWMELHHCESGSDDDPMETEESG